MPVRAVLIEQGASSPALQTLTRSAMLGVSALALTLGLGAAVLTSAPARAQDTRDVVNGASGGGVLLLGTGTVMQSGGNVAGATLGGALDNDGGGAYSIEDTIFTNFATQGGAGSGGGAGLGGVLFVDKGAALTITNVDFRYNTVIGGEGGSAKATDLGTVDIALGDIELPFDKVTTFSTTPALSGTGYSYTVSSFTLVKANPTLQAGMRVVLPGGTTAEIASITPDGKTVTLSSATSIPSDLIYTSADVLAATLPPSTTTLTFTSIDFAKVRVGSSLTIDGGTTSLTVIAVDTNAKTVTFSGALPGTAVTAMNDHVLNPLNPLYPAPDFDFINLSQFDATQIKSVSGNTVTLAAPNAFFKVGMVLSGDGITSGTKIDAISPDGKTLTLSQNFPNNVYSFDATYEQAKASSNVLNVSNSKLAVGMVVTGTGVPPNTVITGINPTNGTVTLSNNLTDKPANLKFNGVAGSTSSSVTVANASMLAGVQAGMIVTGPGIAAGTTVSSVSGTTVLLSGGGVIDASLLSDLSFADPKAQGGTLNGIGQTVTGSAGRDGRDGLPSNLVSGDGEGHDGRNGDAAGNGVVGAGGTGGKGGDGTSALSWNPKLIQDVAFNTVDAALVTAEAASAFANFPPDVAEGIAIGVQAVAAYVKLGLAAAELAEWYIDYGNGDNAAGGNGGNGGTGGNGSEFYGGGVGGAGGNGGDAANTSAGDGGDGGAGGAGGKGGFGAGGGQGGAGGTAGAGVSVADGDAGAGGKGGFGGGVGSDGEGEGGEGGSGFGGAIFVREGGTLLITGNSSFDSNRAQGGSSNNDGDAGKTAGTDLFMMKGSTVTIRPGKTAGVDNVVLFNGSIADNSLASYDHAQYGKGYGAGLTIGEGLVIFNGKNTYTGQTHMVGGVLQAKEGQGLSQYSNLNFDGAGTAGTLTDSNAPVFMTSGRFERVTGTLGDQVQWTGSGGFAAKGGTLEVNLFNLPNPYTLVWGGTPGFFSDDIDNSGALVFGSVHADSAVIWRNGIDLNGLNRTIVVADNPDVTTDFAQITGVISGTGNLNVGQAGSSLWKGTLVLSGQNTFNGDLNVASGTVVVDGALLPGTDVNVGTGAGFVAAAPLDLGAVDNFGTMTVIKPLQADGIDNSGLVIMMADIDLGAYDFNNLTSSSALWVLGVPNALQPDVPSDFEHKLSLDQLTGVAGSKIVLGSLPGDPDPNAPTLVINQSGQSTFDGTIEGVGGIVLTGGTTGAPSNPDSTLTLTATNTYEGATDVKDGSTLRLLDDGAIAESKSVNVDGALDIAGVTTTVSLTTGPTTEYWQGTEINDLTGAGTVAVGNKMLVLHADPLGSLFTGGIWDGPTVATPPAAGGVMVADGIQKLSGTNTYTGETIVLAGAELELIDDGSIEDSWRVRVEGEFDISQTTNGASIKGLEGGVPDADVTLGTKTLTITEAPNTSFAGVIAGSGGLVLAPVTGLTVNSQTLTNANTYTGSTLVGLGADLFLAGNGSIAQSVGVTVNGDFDMSGITADGTTLLGLSGANTGRVFLGEKVLVIENAGLPSGTPTDFAGVIQDGGVPGGTGGSLWIKSGEQTLSGANTYTGDTEISEDATLFIAGAGNLAPTGTLNVLGLFDIAGATVAPREVSISGSLSGDGEVKLGANSLVVTDRDSKTFSGTMGGTGRLVVAGGAGEAADDDNPATVTTRQVLLGATLNNGLTAREGGDVLVVDTTIDTGVTGDPALAVLNGGTIVTGKVTTGTTLTTTGALVSAAFDATATGVRVASIVLGAGTTATPGYSPLLTVARDATEGLDDKVHFTIDSGVEVTGDILDPDAPTTPGGGTTDVTMGTGANWSGVYNAGSFVLGAGSTADFKNGSVVHGDLTAGALSKVYASTGSSPLLVTENGYINDAFLYGNYVFGGDLNFSGYMSPGSSPGFVTVYGDLNVTSPSIQQVYDQFGAQVLLEITYGLTTPPMPGAPGPSGDYDQINIGGDLNGVLKVQLANVIPNGPRSTPLGTIADMDVVRIGGADGGVVQMNRVTQNGREIVLAAHTEARTADPVTGTATPETAFFQNDPITVYSPTFFVQDETFALATLTGTAHDAFRDTVGTYIERRGTVTGAERQSLWSRTGANYTEIIDTVGGTHTTGFTQIGGDLLALGDFRAGLLGSYSSSMSDVVTETGTDSLTGTLYAGGVHASWASGGFYMEALGQYGWSDWTFTPTNASSMKVSGGTVTAAVEAGLGLGTDQFMVTPWGQFVYQTSAFGGLETAWVDGVDFLDKESMQARGGVRAAANLGWLAPYAGVAVSHDFAEVKSVSVDGYTYTTGMGGMRVELGAGFQASVANNISITTDLKGAYGVDSQQIIGYQGQAGLRGSW